MQDGDCAQPHHVYKLNTHGNYPQVPPPMVPPPRAYPLPPRPGAQWPQVLVVLLLFLIFCAMTVQAVFLYHNNPTSTTTSTSNSTRTIAAAAVTEGVHYRNEVMLWSTSDDSSHLHEMTYQDGCLQAKRDGFYFVYSKVFFAERHSFHHSVSLVTDTYPSKPIDLLVARNYPAASANGYGAITSAKSSSYLGGVVHLRKGEALCVRVRNAAQVLRSVPNENFFGAYML
ncbi:hypothetical protein NHX12_031245 [Muraenolepis orangiensis]|uniref:THD domain-containing protein n=1 Tax=Muraenolepis orangiensis TaxID=630683 RepID=A0A9Q0E3B2_9TELE|nr:hypothetical protein NHX12_031245 [Muraenolepis orangiensis]